MSERPPVLDFPLSLFREVTETLASHCDITVIGSFALLEHVDVTSWDQLHTSDIDLLLYLAQSDEVDAVSRSMRELGFMRPNGRNGKWIRAADAAVVDLVSRTCPTGYGPPACLDEPFANVAYLDRQRANRLGAVCDLLPTTAVSVSGPLVTVLGKALKVSRYLDLPDWATNEFRRDRGLQACMDIVRVLQHCRGAITVADSSRLVAQSRYSGKPVSAALHRSGRALSRLFLRVDGIGFQLCAASAPESSIDKAFVVSAVKRICSVIEDDASSNGFLGGLE